MNHNIVIMDKTIDAKFRSLRDCLKTDSLHRARGLQADSFFQTVTCLLLNFLKNV